MGTSYASVGDLILTVGRGHGLHVRTHRVLKERPGAAS
jgi:hypothetical protein